MSTDRLVRESDVEDMLSEHGYLVSEFLISKLRALKPVPPPAGISREAAAAIADEMARCEQGFRVLALESSDFQRASDFEEGASVAKTIADGLRALPESKPGGIEEAQIIKAIVAGRAVVDEANAEFGYDSMVFAEARRAWHETIGPLGAFDNEMRLLKLAQDIPPAADLKAIDEALK